MCLPSNRHKVEEAMMKKKTNHTSKNKKKKESNQNQQKTLPRTLALLTHNLKRTLMMVRLYSTHKTG